MTVTLRQPCYVGPSYRRPLANGLCYLGDEIRIVIPEIDRYTSPSESELVIEGKLRLSSDVSKNSATASLIHDAEAFMFSHIRYIISGVEVDEVRNVGITSAMKEYFSYSPSYVNKLENCGWDVGTGKALIMDTKGNVNICIPLKMLMGFAEDFKQVVMNVSQELVLKRYQQKLEIIGEMDPFALKDTDLDFSFDSVPPVSTMDIV
ncbi:hypothetical protein MML48_2g00013811 [Holotrichia oblita]|uniref:Uncharacterized protein n=1 Tax=Holotrichia oblita TaxID=644536 RepID=A0ACB9TMY9_HOLOL|nr:hypothetical protein MML48_2g00013811 [Holotrichia oblita]